MNLQVPYNNKNKNRAGNFEYLNDVRGSQNNEEPNSNQYELKQTGKFVKKVTFNPNKVGFFEGSFF